MEGNEWWANNLRCHQWLAGEMLHDYSKWGSRLVPPEYKTTVLQEPKTEPQTSGIPDPGEWSFVVVYLCSHAQVFATSWIVACWAPLSMGFPRQEYWSGLPFPSLEDLPNPGTEPVSPALADRFFTTEPLGSPCGPYPWLEKPPDIDGGAQ